MTDLDNVPVAFALVIAAGLSTAIGAAAVYFNRLVQIASKPVLAAGLGFSAGVMLYVSFVEIFVKSQGAFAEEYDEEHAYIYATVCLFAGMALLRLIALLVHAMDGGHSHCVESQEEGGAGAIRHNVMGASDVPGGLQPGMAGDAAAEGAQADAPDAGAAEAGGAQAPPAGAQGAEPDTTKDRGLERMGLNTAAAIAIHNFPEGLATFVATLAEPAVGATLAIAIAIHNIPEGLCVALPIYYATGSRHKGFLWALFSGISEPIGAFIGWVIIKSTGDDMNQTVYGVLFGIVAGMMVMIVLLELLPTGYRYDPKDRFVTNSLVAGMLVMAFSLCLFLF